MGAAAASGAALTAPSRTILAGGNDRRAALSLAAAVGVEAAAGAEGALDVPRVLLAELDDEPRRRPATLLASQTARELERELRAEGAAAVARGHICHLGLEAGVEANERLAELSRRGLTDVVLVALPATHWHEALGCERLCPDGGLLLARMPGERSLAALAVAEMHSRGMAVRVATRPPGPLTGRRALAGVRPGGACSRRAARLARGLRLAPRRSGQALPLVSGAAAAVLGAALVLTSIGGAATGASRVQRAADLAAVSAAREMRDLTPRMLAPRRRADGTPNPGHLPRAAFLAAARRAALDAGRRNGVDPARLRIGFPDRDATPPLRAKVVVRGEIDPSELPGGARLDAEATERGAAAPAPIEVVARAVAEAGAPAATSWPEADGTASGGGYSGPLVHRNGEGMRPDVAAAFDRMAAAARAAGHALVVNSGFRSDAEQAALFAANPDPRWVAPPGRSLHRCATELDLGPASAYGWLAAKARRFGFEQRYSWEPWHYGFIVGPPPCSAAGEAGGHGGPGPDGGSARSGLPGFVPAAYHAPLQRSAARWGVSAALLAAQLKAESNFDPRAVSSAGAQGIAQFMPGTAASYGLRDPFDPVAAIDAQAHLMADLLRSLGGSVPLALAAYNAGPGAVTPCMCIPPYPETRAYVARIMALVRGVGALAAPELEVRLVR